MSGGVRWADAVVHQVHPRSLKDSGADAFWHRAPAAGAPLRHTHAATGAPETLRPGEGFLAQAP